MRSVVCSLWLRLPVLCEFIGELFYELVIVFCCELAYTDLVCGFLASLLVFLFCELKCNNKIITSATGVWKILKVKPSNLGPGG